jgi:protein associated with RNAse G/E
LESTHYTIDTCSLIAGWRNYPPDIFPGLWEHLAELSSKGTLHSTEEVLIELKKNDDDLLGWAKSQSGLFTPVDENIQVEVLKVLKDHPTLYDIEKNKSGADPFVIAHALQNGYTVITEEKKTGSLSKPKIPNVCEYYGIRYINLINLLREQGLKFGGI